MPRSEGAAIRNSRAAPFHRVLIIPVPPSVLYTFLSLLEPPWPSSNPHWPESGDRFNNTAIFPAHGPNTHTHTLHPLRNASPLRSSPLLSSPLAYPILFSFSYRLIPHRAQRFVVRCARPSMKGGPSWLVFRVLEVTISGTGGCRSYGVEFIRTLIILLTQVR